MQITLQDIKSDDRDWSSFTKLVGKQIKDIRGYFVTRNNYPYFHIVDIVMEDGSLVDVEGDYDNAFITMFPSHPQPNLDYDTLTRLYHEQNEQEQMDFDKPK